MPISPLGGFALALPPLPGALLGSQTNLRVDASGERVEYYFQVPRSGSMNRAAIRLSTVLTDQPLRIGFETLDASGVPTGTAYGGSVPVVLTTLVSNSTREAVFTTPATAVAGVWVAVVIQFNGAIGDVQIATAATLAGGAGSPYVVHNSGSRVPQTAAVPLLSIGFADTSSYEPIGCLPAGSISAQNISTVLTPNDLGNLYQLPVPFRARGAGVLADADNPFELRLYGPDNTVLAASVLGLPYRANTAQGVYSVPFPAAVDLAAGTQYRLTVKPLTASNVVAYRLACDTQAHLDPWLAGEWCHETSRVDAGSWTETTANRMMMGLYGSAIDDGVAPPRGSGVWA